MNKKLSILIPYYNETIEQIRTLLGSIQSQYGIDFSTLEVIMCGDGPESTKLYKNIIKASYSFNVTIIPNPPEKVGVSELRNMCFQNSTGEYVMWCDADDMFFNNMGLWMIFNEIDNGGFDTLASSFLAEFVKDDGKYDYQLQQGDTIFVHGKVHSREFLLREGIKWNPDLTIHEDSFFTIQCRELSTNSKYIPGCFYMWRHNENSVSRKDEKYMLKTYQQLIDSIDALADVYLSKAKYDLAEKHIVSMVYDTYFSLNCEEWFENTNQTYRNTVESRFKKFFKKYMFIFDAANDTIKKQAIAGIKNRFFMTDSMFLEKVTFDDWISKIREEEDE